MSFVATANPPASTTEPTIANDGWFPDMVPSEVRDACRLDGTVTTARLRPALVAAMLSVNAELQTWASMQQAAGWERLADVPAPTIGGESAKLQQYRRAVHACLQADLAEAYRDIDTTPQGSGKDARVLEGLAIKVDEHRRNQRWAVSDLIGRGRATVELI